MKLATLKDGSRDGTLVIVSRDLEQCTSAADIAPSLQAALDDWAHHGPALAQRASALAIAEAPVTPFRPDTAESPLPRAYAWLDGSAYVNHVELVRRARGAELPASFLTDPLMYQGGSDSFLGPRDPILVGDEAWGIDLEAELAVIVDDVPMGASRAQAGAAIRLLMLVNDVSLRALVANEIGKGFGFVHAKPSSAFSPVAVTPDELGGAWRDGKLHLPMRIELNGTPLGRVDAGVDMTFDFPTLVAHAAHTRPLGAGTIVGSGTVSNKGQDGGPGKPVHEGGKGYACIAEVRVVEQLLSGSATTPFLRFGDEVQIDMHDEHGATVFGAIQQKVARNDS